MRSAIARGVLASAHDCSLGGLAVTLAESSLLGGLGARINPPLASPERAKPSWPFGLLFGESQGRYLVSLRPSALEAAQALFGRHRVSFQHLGVVGGSVIAVEGFVEIRLEAARDAWAGGIAASFGPSASTLA
jgi:phosphoribosylformylglycinamidine synthase